MKIIKKEKDYFDQTLDEIKILGLLNGHDPTGQYPILRLFDAFYFKERPFMVNNPNRIPDMTLNNFN